MLFLDESLAHMEEIEKDDILYSAFLMSAGGGAHGLAQLNNAGNA